MSLEDRFWSKVTISGLDDCWNWKGAVVVNHCGLAYGSFFYEGRQHPAHRVSYTLVRGVIPKGLVVRHDCDNPSCVNPLHLRVGTHKDNARDMEQRGRGAKSRQTHCVRGHPLFGENLVRDKRNYRLCRKCRAMKSPRPKPAVGLLQRLEMPAISTKQGSR